MGTAAPCDNENKDRDRMGMAPPCNSEDKGGDKTTRWDHHVRMKTGTGPPHEDRDGRDSHKDEVTHGDSHHTRMEDPSYTRLVPPLFDTVVYYAHIFHYCIYLF
jgi:hypothetical protein